MAKLSSNLTIHQWQDFSRKVYGFSNDRAFGTMEMLSNIERFTMRALKGIRKHDDDKTIFNLLIAISWFVSLMNQLHIDLEEQVWQRFPSVCSYCGTKPCSCKIKKIKKRQEIIINNKLRPKKLKEFQEMFSEIYPPDDRSLESAGIHLAEEMGELSEAMMTYLGSHKDNDFQKISSEAADLFSCFIGVFNSLDIDLSNKLAKMFYNNCHECHKSPCECNFSYVMNYKS